MWSVLWWWPVFANWSYLGYVITFVKLLLEWCVNIRRWAWADHLKCLACCYILRIITNHYMCSNWRTLVSTPSYSLYLTNLECTFVSLSLHALYSSSTVWVFPLFPSSHDNVMSNIRRSLVFYTVNSPWHGWWHEAIWWWIKSNKHN